MITNPNFFIPKAFQPDVVDLWYSKLWVMSGQIVKVWNIKGLLHLVANILGLQNRFCDHCTSPLEVV